MRRTLALLLVLGALAAAAGHAAPATPNRIVFASNRGPNVNNPEIFSIRADGSRFRDLSRSQRPDGSPVWSPDGRQVAFWSERVEQGVFARALYVMQADGSRQRRLTPPELSVTGVDEPPSWSPDGTRIVFGADSPLGRGIWVVRTDGSGLTFVARGLDPDWSPRSNQIAFGRIDHNDMHVGLVNADGSGLRLLTDGDGFDRMPSWAPDGRSLAFVRFDAEPPASALYRIGVDGAGLRRLAPTTFDLVARSPSWAPNGNRIAFSYASGVWVVSPHGTGLRRLALGSGPTFSPNGRKLAFVRGPALVVVNPDGSAQHVVRRARGDFFTSGPVWSPNSSTLVFSTLREVADHELYSVDANGAHRRRLTDNILDERLPAWSPARRRIAFVQGGHIFVMSASGTGRRHVALGSYPTWSRTGTEIAFSRGGMVYVVPDRGGLARPLAVGTKPSWSSRDGQIAFVRGLDLIVLDRRSRTERVITDLDCDGSTDTPTIVGIPEWSPDGRRLVVPLLCFLGRPELPVALVVDADGGRRAYLPLDDLDFARLAFSPDGSRIAFTNYTGFPRIATAGLDGTAPATVTQSAGDDRDLDW